MCGLSGIARVDGQHVGEEADALLRRMTRAVAHRGPDDETFLRSGPVGLGFVRLSLVAPENGAQPLSTDDGSLVLIANGEVYNHRELAAGLPAGTRMRTGSDCEVLLHLYRRDGLNFLDNVRGMFSLVLWDRDRGRLIMARDRFGIKPLFYHLNRERIVFGSEIKALFEDRATPRELDWDAALTDQMVSLAPVTDDSPAHAWFQGIELVPAASVVTVDLRGGSVATHRYWDFPTYDGTSTASEAELVADYGRYLAESVAECQMADTEIGLFLSGGIDSAAVAALAGIKPHTFTALNGSTLGNGDAESAHRIAAHLGLANDQVLFHASHTPTVEEWKRHLWLLETPLAGPESFYKYEMYRYVADTVPSIKAMLLGGGADEFNGGYTRSVARGGDWNDFLANVGAMGAARDAALRPDLAAWWNRPGGSLVSDRYLREAAGGPSTDPYAAHFRWKYRDVQQYNCWHEDRTAAGSGIEARVPFLDHRLVELVAAVPERLRPSLVWDKQILRRSMAGVLPPEFAQRPKGPFFYGPGEAHTFRAFVRMLSQDGDRLVEEALSGPGARHHLDADRVRGYLRTLQRDPSRGHVELLLRVVNLGLLEQMTLERPAPHIDSAAAPVALRVPVADWDAERELVEEQVVPRAELDPSGVLALDESVLLLCDPAEPAQWYLLVDGTTEYVLDADEDPDWVRLLRGLDGKRPLAEVLADLDIEAAAVAPLVAESLELGLLTARDRTHAAPMSA
ncbi:asparagine synthase (glutamine-hydrolyzing) [Streptomyces sp. NPDC096339]|uniref:asparagine synthase (glutamine-hydrolyzing) n=1 Tax=Streptomyces sp. NPDC096339 TaxID=3366086 RepID=UPI003824E723